MASKMDAKQLAEASKQISKAADGGDPPGTLLALLAPLEQWKATEEQLRATKIGIAVSKLRTSSDKRVAAQASQLINKWKADVKKRPGTPTSSSPATNRAATATSNGASGTASPAPAPASAAPPAKKFSVEPEKRNSKEDGVNTALTGDAARDACIRLMYDGLAYMSEVAPDDLLAVARAVERAAFEAYKPDVSPAYKSKMRSLYQNLKMKSNDWLRKSVSSGGTKPDKFVVMSSDDLKSAEKRASDAVLEKENMNKAMTAQEEKAISTTMQCGKCKQNRVAYSQAQTRSADEPMTTFCECINCGNRWKFS